jgi:hypothetical protein
MNAGLLSLPQIARPAGLVLLGRRVFRDHVGHSFVKEFSPDIDEYVLIVNNLVQSVGGAAGAIVGRFSIDAGATFDSTANYVWGGSNYHATNNQLIGSTGGTSFVTGRADNDAGYGMCGVYHIFVNNRGLYTQVIGNCFARNQDRGANDPQGVIIAVAYRNTRRVNGLRIFIEAGVIVSGEARLYGLYKG